MLGYNFTDDVRRGLEAAREEALRFRHDEVEPFHLLLGVLRYPGARCKEAFIQLGLQPNEVYESIVAAPPPPLAHPIGGPDFPYTPSAKRVLERSMAESQRLGHSEVAPEHLLIAILVVSEELDKKLHAEGVNIKDFRAAVSRVAKEDRKSGVRPSWSIESSPHAIKWFLLFLGASRAVAWIALVVAIIALIIAIRPSR